jgi:hypothetical protein
MELTHLLKSCVMYTVSTGLALATCQMFDEDGTPLVL